MSMARASERRTVQIARPADDVWAIVGDAGRLHEWWPGVVSSEMNGDTRTVVTGAGLTMPEQVITCDPLQRRFQYRLRTGVIREHLGTIDVIPLGDNDTLVVYGTDADPATMALVIAGAAGNALRNLRDLMEQNEIS